MDFDEALKLVTPPPAPSTRIGRFLEAADEVQRGKILRAMRNREVFGTDIAKALRLMGLEISERQVQEYRRLRLDA